MTIPIIRLEVEGMKHQIMVALTAYAAQMDSDIQAAVDEYCTPEHITATVKNIAKGEIDKAIKEEVSKFFSYGNGRTAIMEAVKATLEEAK